MNIEFEKVVECWYNEYPQLNIDLSVLEENFNKAIKKYSTEKYANVIFTESWFVSYLYGVLVLDLWYWQEK